MRSLGMDGFYEPNVNVDGFVKPNLDVDGFVKSNLDVDGLIDINLDVDDLIEPNIDVDDLIEPNIDVDDLIEPNIDVDDLIEPNIDVDDLIEPNLDIDNFIDTKKINGEEKSSLVIRKFMDGDTEQIVSLFSRVLSEFGEEYNPGWDSDLLNIPEHYGNGGAFWVLLDDSKIVGTVAISRVSDDVCKYRRFYLDKKYRGKGWGRRMYDVRYEFAKNNNYKTAWTVTSSNHTEAISFFEKMGAVYSPEPLFPNKRANMYFTYDLI